ncbi:MAG: type I-U CRISPR-associated protein Cas5/Cas6 [Desulfobulbaceae bacterium A2]|nr:MAG: type I-U CRISPR-associated protein Cas5/Cas6 [Desulfobulbaceae bacterium A2]
MPTLILSFPAGRYHATPWGHHVNEGLIEWPPAPWRLLRALLATGYAKLGWPTDGPPPVVKSLIEKLASRLPVYRLPKAVGAHSRHYMPLATLDKGRENTTLVFDTWARVDGELAINWDVELTLDELKLLDELVENLDYLGRSESWVVARMAQENEPLPADGACWPEEGVPPAGPGWEQVPLIAPVSAGDYVQWRQKAVNAILAGMPQPKPGKKPTAKMEQNRQKAEAPYPHDLIACLQTQTSDWKAHGWSQPPGSRRVFYWRRADALEVGPPSVRRGESALPVEAVLLAMATQTGNEHALPHVNRTLSQAERLHQQIVGHLNGRNNQAITGKDELRQPLLEPHRHAHILPLDLNGDGHLDHFLIWADMGLDGEAQNAIRAVRRTFAKNSPDPVRLAWAGAGSIEDFLRLSGQYGTGLQGILQKNTEWISVTPFVPSRYLKKNGKNSLEGQIAAELASRGLPTPLAVERMDSHSFDLARKQRHFIRARHRQPPPIDCGFTIKLQFAEPVSGPICLGYGSHFGLGLFRGIKATELESTP